MDGPLPALQWRTSPTKGHLLLLRECREENKEETTQALLTKLGSPDFSQDKALAITILTTSLEETLNITGHPNSESWACLRRHLFDLEALRCI